MLGWSFDLEKSVHLWGLNILIWSVRGLGWAIWAVPSPLTSRDSGPVTCICPLFANSSAAMRTSEGHLKVKVKDASRVWLCNSMDCIVHGILQARILEWVAFPFSTGSSQPRDQTQVSCFAGRFFTDLATREAQEHCVGSLSLLRDLPDPGNEPGSPALQADSLPPELLGKQRMSIINTVKFRLLNWSYWDS